MSHEHQKTFLLSNDSETVGVCHYCGGLVSTDGRGDTTQTIWGFIGGITGYNDDSGNFVHYRRYCADQGRKRYKK